MRTLLLLAALALALPAAYAQDDGDDDVVVEVLFDFEGDDGMGDVQGWVSVQDADTLSDGSAPADIQAVDQKAVSASDFIDAFNGTYLLEATPNRGLKARTFRGARYTWDTPQDWTNRSTLRLAASMNARGASSEKHEYRIRVFSGSGADADTAVAVFEGLKSEGFGDGTDNNSFVNDWEVLSIDLEDEDDFDLTQITAIEATGRNVDDGTDGTPGPDGNWGGLVHVDYVTIEGEDAATDVEGAPGLESLSQAFPNPATNRAAVRLAVDDAQRVVVTLHDVLGRTVATALDAPLTPGAERSISFDTSRLSAGTYLIRVQGETFSQTRRLTVAR